MQCYSKAERSACISHYLEYTVMPLGKVDHVWSLESYVLARKIIMFSILFIPPHIGPTGPWRQLLLHLLPGRSPATLEPQGDDTSKINEGGFAPTCISFRLCNTNSRSKTQNHPANRNPNNLMYTPTRRHAAQYWATGGGALETVVSSSAPNSWRKSPPSTPATRRAERASGAIGDTARQRQHARAGPDQQCPG